MTAERMPAMALMIVLSPGKSAVTALVMGPTVARTNVFEPPVCAGLDQFAFLANDVRRSLVAR